jgi:chromosome segregation ATPase
LIDICFEINNMFILLDNCADSENKVKESTYSLSEILNKLSRELEDLKVYSGKVSGEVERDIAALRAMINEVSLKEERASAKKQALQDEPPKPSIPQNATEAEKRAIESSYQKKSEKVKAENKRIDEENRRAEEYLSRCGAAKRELEVILSKLCQIQSSVKKELSSALSEADGYMKRLRESVNHNAKVNEAMGEFYLVIRRVYESAQRLCMMEPSAISGYSYIDKQFKIKNTHYHNSEGSKVSFGFSKSEESFFETSSECSREDNSSEILIKAREESAFFEMAEGAECFKMPSSNLNKLGGKAFIKKMNDAGYKAVKQADGSTIDNNGMIHWERTDD